MEKQDIRVVRTKKRIKESFFKLIQEKPFSEISVKELCDLAECSRNAFYEHYEYKDNLFISVSKECVASALSGIYAITSAPHEINDEIIYKVCKNFLKGISDCSKELSILLKHDYENIFHEEFASRIFSLMMESTADSAKDYNVYTDEWRLAISYNAGGFLGFVIYWLDHPEISFERAHQILTELMHSAMFLGEKYLL